MAFWKRHSGKFEPSTFGSKHCKYGAYYLGKMQTDGESGLDCTLQPVNNMYKMYKQSKGRNAQRMTVEITRQGVLMHQDDNLSPRVPEPNVNDTLLPVAEISFGTAVPGHDKVFAVVVRNETSPGIFTWDCHGFLCDSASTARDLTLLLVKAFQRASAAGEISHPMSVDDASKQSKPTTLHILNERGRLEHQRLQRTKSSPAVSTIKVTLNVEYKRPSEPPKPRLKGRHKKKEYVDPHKAFAEALAKRDREKDILGLLDKPLDESSKTTTTTTTPAAKTSPLRRVKSESHAMRRGIIAGTKTHEKENQQRNMSSVQEETITSSSDSDNKRDSDDVISSDSSRDSSSNHTTSSSDSEQEIVVALNPLMSILKNPSRPFREGNESSTSGTLTFRRDSPRSDNEENGTSPESKDAKRVKRKSVRFTAHTSVVIDD